jgi:hypothetical protein
MGFTSLNVSREVLNGSLTLPVIARVYDGQISKLRIILQIILHAMLTIQSLVWLWLFVLAQRHFVGQIAI